MTSAEKLEFVKKTMAELLADSKKLFTEYGAALGETGAKEFAHPEVGLTAYVAATDPITNPTEAQWRSSVYTRCVPAYPLPPRSSLMFVCFC
jgi:hypothetical protein